MFINEDGELMILDLNEDDSDLEKGMIVFETATLGFFAIIKEI